MQKKKKKKNLKAKPKNVEKEASTNSYRGGAGGMRGL